MGTRINYIYDDKTENLLMQYTQQLSHHEELFLKANGDLSPGDFARHRDHDPAICAILEVIALVYERSTPIAITITNTNDEKPTLKGSEDPWGSCGGTKH